MYICAFTKNVYYKNLYLLIDTHANKEMQIYTHIYMYMYVSIEQLNVVPLLTSRVIKFKD